MLADAIAAERFRLSRDRVSLFWGFAFALLVAMLFSIAVDMFTRAVLHPDHSRRDDRPGQPGHGARWRGPRVRSPPCSC